MNKEMLYQKPYDYCSQKKMQKWTKCTIVFVCIYTMSFAVFLVSMRVSNVPFVHGYKVWT